MDKKIWLILGIVSCLAAAILITLAIVVPILKKDKIPDDYRGKSTIKSDNTNLWAAFPGDLKSTTKHTLNVLEYADGDALSAKETIELEEKINYTEIQVNEADKRAYFFANSTYELKKNESAKNEKIKTLSLGLFETLETLSNPPEYQKGINGIQYLFNKVFQSSDLFIKHLFAYVYYNTSLQDDGAVRETILKDVEKRKADKILSNLEKYEKYSFKKMPGFYQWVKLLENSEEVKKATWLVDLFELTQNEIDSILGDNQFLHQQYLKYNTDLSTKYNCTDPQNCGNEIIYNQLISGKVLSDIDTQFSDVRIFYEKFGLHIYPYHSAPELYNYLDNIRNYVEVGQLSKLMDPSSEFSLLSASNSALFSTLIRTNNEEKIQELYGISLEKATVLSEYFYKILPQLFIYRSYIADDWNSTEIQPEVKAFSTITENIIEKTYYKLSKIKNLYEKVLSKLVWSKLGDKIDNSSMKYDDEDICPLLMQRVLDDGKKVLKICSDPVTSFNTPLEFQKWFPGYYCVKGGEPDKCDMTLINHLKTIVYITENEIKSIYSQDGLGDIIERSETNLKTAWQCGEKCDNDYLIKMQFWKSFVSLNLPEGFNKSDTLCTVLPELISEPAELYYYAKQKDIKDFDNITEAGIDTIISLTPVEEGNILSEENCEIYQKILEFEEKYNSYLEGRVDDNGEFTAIEVLNKAYLFDKEITTEYESANNILQGSSTEEKIYLDFLSEGAYYDNFKPSIAQTTGFNFGINLSTGEKQDVEYDKYSIHTDETGGENLQLRKIISINDCPLLNIRKLEYDYFSKSMQYIHAPLFNFQTLEGEKSFVDGFQYDHAKDKIYYYDKISSRPFKFSYSEDKKYHDYTCRKYVLNKENIADDIDESNELKSDKAFLTQKLNKPVVITIGTDGLNKKIENVSEENYICVEENSNMVVESKINFVYSIYTKKFGYINSNIKNDQLLPIFTYSRDYEVSMDSFETVFPYMKDFKSFKTTFSTLMIIFIVLLAILSFFCFFKYFCSGRQRIVIQPIQDQEKHEASQNLINDSRKLIDD